MPKAKHHALAIDDVEAACPGKKRRRKRGKKKVVEGHDTSYWSTAAALLSALAVLAVLFVLLMPDRTHTLLAKLLLKSHPSLSPPSPLQLPPNPVPLCPPAPPPLPVNPSPLPWLPPPFAPTRPPMGPPPPSPLPLPLPSLPTPAPPHGCSHGCDIGFSTVDRINRRFNRSPYLPWPADGILPDQGLLIHCFDAVEDGNEPWRPRLATEGHGDNPSGSIIFAEQGLTLKGTPQFGPGTQLFGHACADGGVILRPGHIKVHCGTGTDCGAGCCVGQRKFCPRTGSATSATGKPCTGAWHPADVHIYIERDTRAYRRDPGWQESYLQYGKYNGALPSPDSISGPRTQSDSGRLGLELALPGACSSLVVHAAHPRKVVTSIERIERPPNPPMSRPAWRLQCAEFIIDGLFWDRQLPNSIDAFMSGRGMSTATHEAFLRKYRVTADEVPLLTMQPDYDRPFFVGSTYASHGDPCSVPLDGPSALPSLG